MIRLFITKRELLYTNYRYYLMNNELTMINIIVGY